MTQYENDPFDGIEAITDVDSATLTVPENQLAQLAESIKGAQVKARRVVIGTSSGEIELIAVEEGKIRLRRNVADGSLKEDNNE